jgi:hypothetical protein
LFWPKTWGLGIGWRFSLHLHPYPQFTTAKKTCSKIFAILFLKCILNLNTYLWKKRMPKSNHYYPKYGIWRLGQGNASVCSMATPLVCIYIRRGKLVSGIPIFFLWECSHLQYLPTQKKTHQRPIISPPNMEVQKLKKNSLIIRTDARPLYAIPSASEK